MAEACWVPLLGWGGRKTETANTFVGREEKSQNPFVLVPRNFKMKEGNTFTFPHTTKPGTRKREWWTSDERHLCLPCPYRHGDTVSNWDVFSAVFLPLRNRFQWALQGNLIPVSVSYPSPPFSTPAPYCKRPRGQIIPFVPVFPPLCWDPASFGD